MGRPREHDERTAATLLAAAERIVQANGAEALSVRGVAADAGTTTRAVYSLFGSKDGLLTALTAHAFELLSDRAHALPVTDDPAADLVAAGLMFRRFATEHPSLYALGFQRGRAVLAPWPEVRRVAFVALERLKQRVQRLADAGLLGGRTVDEVTLQFDALCEGLAVLELRGGAPGADWERLWRDALAALVAGYPATVSHSA